MLKDCYYLVSTLFQVTCLTVKCDACVLPGGAEDDGAAGPAVEVEGGGAGRELLLRPLPGLQRDPVAGQEEQAAHPVISLHVDAGLNTSESDG